MAREMRDSKRRFKEASHTAAVLDYQTLLSELIKQPTVEWEDVQDSIANDMQVTLSA